MRQSKSFAAMILAAAFLEVQWCDAQPSQYQLTVPGQSNTYGAGHAQPPAPGGGGAGVLPPVAVLPAGQGRVLEFTSVTGLVDCCGRTPAIPPDGQANPTDVPSWDGISGIVHDGASMFLAGVFLSESEPTDPSPIRLHFGLGGTPVGFVELSPLLQQSFFIGDGMEGPARQVFHVPDGATRLFLGFVDARGFGETLPGWYFDNTGEFAAEFLLSQPAGPIVVSLPDTFATYNQEPEIPVRVSHTTGTGIVAAEVELAYDGDLLNVLAVSNAGCLAAGWTLESNLVHGHATPIDTLKIAMATASDTLFGAGALAKVQFRVADIRHPASSALHLVHALFNDGVPATSAADGAVRVIGANGLVSTVPEVIIPRQSIQVTVIDPDENRDPATVQAVAVQVRSGAQTEALTLQETEASSFVFTGTIATVFSAFPSPESGDGIVQAKAGDQIVFLYEDSLDVTGNTVLRADTTQVRGGKDGRLRVTVVSQPGDTVRVRVTDGDLNTNPGVSESWPIGVRNVRTGEVETATLSERSVDDTVFFGGMRSIPDDETGTDHDGVINTRKADTLVVSYVDSLTALGAIVEVQDRNKVVNPFGDADGNGQVQAYDASRVLYHRLSPYLVGLDSLTANVDLGAPFGPITAYDAALILQRRVGRIWRFPVQEDESVNHPQPETDLSVPKAIGERLITLQPGAGHVSVWAEEREGIVSGELEVEGITGEAVMAPELGQFLVKSQVTDGGVRVVFAGAEGVAGPGELVRLYGVGPRQVQLTRAWLNDGHIGVRLGDGAVAAVLPLTFALHGPQPNPFNPETTIRLDLPQAGLVRLEVFDVVGQRVRVLASGELPAGVHQVKWDGRNEQGVPVSSGMYLCRLQAGTLSYTRRMVLVK
jgi:hypothetical protein